MKSRLTLAIVGCALLTLLNPYILTAQAADYGTNRQPRTCPSRSAPTSGAIGARQAAIYVACEKESVGYQTNYSRDFIDIFSIQVSKPRQVTGNDLRSFNNIDTTKPAYDLRGSVVGYKCYRVNNGGSYQPGHNCHVWRVPESVGACVQDTFGAWQCTMSTYSPTSETKMPAPN
jgi:hypothetical protein